MPVCLRQPALEKLLPSGILVGLTVSVILFPLATFGLVDLLSLRHERAYEKWIQRQPPHYRYTISVAGTFIFTKFQVEVLNGNPVQLTDLVNGYSVAMLPHPAWSHMPGYLQIRNHLLIENLFIDIHMGTVLRRSAKNFMGRANPALYRAMVNRGWLPGGWMGCDPAFPQVRYNKIYAYPEELNLHGNPCSALIEQSQPLKITIEDFQTLP